MLPALHKGVAFIVSSLITRKNYVTIEYQHQRASMFAGEINERIDLHDFQRGTNLSGTYRSGQCQIHDAQTNHSLSVEINGNTFSGVDLSSGAAFRGSVDRDRVFLFDEETRQRFVLTAHPERTISRPHTLRTALSGSTDSA